MLLYQILVFITHEKKNNNNNKKYKSHAKTVN